MQKAGSIIKTSFASVLITLLLVSFGFRKNYFETFIDDTFLPYYSNSEQVIKHKAYTLCYDHKHKQAKWVIYRITKEMLENSSVKRSNKFAVDPFIKNDPVVPEDYTKSGYDRGHLCPAADMSWSEQAMNESFFMSNMSPQTPSFNRGIWKKLEEKVREWAIKDQSLYIVTAGVLNDTMPAIGKIFVPKYFYKIIVDYKLLSNKGIAFLMENKPSKESLFNYAVPIDSIEKITGIDFFHSIPDSLENSLESKMDTLLWK